MNIALCQVNPTVGAIKQNKQLILDRYAEAISLGAELVVFPELVLIGYPPQDLLLRKQFIKNAQIALNEIADQSTAPIILGSTLAENDKLYNCSFVCANGQVIDHYKKMLLPTYDVFDEDRYFKSGDKPVVVEVQIGSKNKKIGLQICEDLWDYTYSQNLSDELKTNGAELIINISASPYRVDRLVDRCNLIKEKVNSTGIPFLYCNLVGAQDELIFDGQSVAYDGKGNLIAQCKAFVEEISMIDLDNQESLELNVLKREEKIYNALVLGVKDYFKKTGHSEAVLGLSGGIDSSLTACIAVDALGKDNVHGVSMPSKYSSEHSKQDAKKLSDNLGIDYQVVSIESIVDSFEHSL